MKSSLSTAGLRCSLFVVLMAGSLLVAQDKKPDAKAPSKKVVNRLPNNFGKLGLTDEQKAKILEIQAANDPKIAELNAQLKALKDKETADVEAVLTADQQKQLADIKAAAKKKSDDDKAAAKAKGKGGDKKPEAATTEVKKPETEKKPTTEKKP